MGGRYVIAAAAPQARENESNFVVNAENIDIDTIISHVDHTKISVSNN